MSSSNTQFKIPSKKANRYGPLPEVPLRPDLLKFMPSDIRLQFVSRNTTVDEQTTHTETHLRPLVTPRTPAFESSVSDFPAVNLLNQIPPTPPETPIEASSTPNPSGSSLLPPVDIPPPFQHSQPRLRAPKRTQAEIQSERFAGADRVLKAISEEGFDSLGDFLVFLFEKPKPDYRTSRHKDMVARFLQGRNKFLPVEVLDNMFSNSYSSPTYRTSEEVHHPLFSSIEPYDIPYARPSLSAWATKHVARQAHLQIGSHAYPSSKDDSLEYRRLYLSTNGRQRSNIRLITWEDLRGFCLENLAKELEEEITLPWYLLQQMAAPSEKGVFVIRKQRPYPQVSFFFTLT